MPVYREYSVLTQVIAAGFATAGIFTGLVVPAVMVASIGMVVVYFLGGGATETAEPDVSRSQVICRPCVDQLGKLYMVRVA